MSVRHNGTLISSWRAVHGPPGRRVQSVLSTNVVGYFVFFKTGKEVYTACQKTFHDSGVSVASPRGAVLSSASADFAEEEINVSGMPTSSMHVVESASAVVVGSRQRPLLQSEMLREKAMPLPRCNNASSAVANLTISNDNSQNSAQSGVKRRAPSAYFEVPISDESWCGSERTQINGTASMAAVGNHIATHSFQPARRRTAEPSATPSAVSPNLSQPEPAPLPPSSASPRSSAGTASTSTNVMRSEDAYASSPGATKILECPECGLNIRGKRGNLNRHIATKHRNFRPFRCLMPDCGRALQSRLNLIRHMKKVHEGRPFRCSSCPRGFRSHDALIQHESGVHGGMGTGNGIGDFESECENCGAKFFGVGALEEHRLECTAENPNGFQCATRACGKRFGTWTELARHRTNVHKNCTYTCSECSRGFQNEHDISRHIRLDHLQVQAANRCEECDSVFEKKSDLLRHSSLAHRESSKQRQR